MEFSLEREKSAEKRRSHNGCAFFIASLLTPALQLIYAS